MTAVPAGFVGGGRARAMLAVEPIEAAHVLLGALFTAHGVTVRIVEVEAYHGEQDPASHAFRGRTERNKVMFGPAGHLYVYRSYGIHTCMNVSAGVEGDGWAVLLRAGAVTGGADIARERRAAARTDAQLARGPGNLGRALAVDMRDAGADLLTSSGISLALPAPGTVDRAQVRSGPRVGVSAAADVPWRLWLAGEPAVSAYRRSPRAPSTG